MANAKKVDEFIKETFATYSLNYSEFFEEDIDEENEDLDLDLEEPEYALNVPMVELAAKILGVEKNEILETNDNAVMKWFKKYPYFWHRPAFDEAYRRSFHDERYDAARFLEVIFETTVVPDCPTRYDYENVKTRLVELLKTIDQSIPGTYHPNATMNSLSIHTENFCHFDDIEEMVKSYIDMFNRVKELFFKAWDNDLSADEIHEYNFLVATIGIQDRYYIKGYLFYNILKKFIPIYKSEGHTDFSAYTRIYHRRVLKPWKCAEFTLNKDLVQSFVDIYPHAKQEMREFALQVSKFNCYFIWSDARPAISSQAELDEINDVAESLGEETISFENCAKEPTQVYVSKTTEELSGDDKFAEQLRILSGPANLGGVRVTNHEYKFTANDVAGLQARVFALSKNQEGNLHE